MLHNEIAFAFGGVWRRHKEETIYGFLQHGITFVFSKYLIKLLFCLNKLFFKVTHLAFAGLIAKVNDVLEDLSKIGKHTKIRKEYHTFKYLARF